MFRAWFGWLMQKNCIINRTSEEQRSRNKKTQSIRKWARRIVLEKRAEIWVNSVSHGSAYSSLRSWALSSWKLHRRHKKHKISNSFSYFQSFFFSQLNFVKSSGCAEWEAIKMWKLNTTSWRANVYSAKGRSTLSPFEKMDFQITYTFYVLWCWVRFGRTRIPLLCSFSLRCCVCCRMNECLLCQFRCSPENVYGAQSTIT